jgi:hypothetical protein
MPDLHTSPLPAGDTTWQATDVFRETFLLRVSPAGKATLLRQLGPLLHELAGATDRLACPDEPPARAGLRAALADLDHLQGVLAGLARQAEAEPHPEEDPRHLQVLQALAATTLRRMTAVLEDALTWSTDPDSSES